MNFKNWKTFDLLTARYLDTEFESSNDWEALNNELSNKGYIYPIRFLINLFFAPALVWNAIWWEWQRFTWVDLVVGWLTNFIVVGIGLCFYSWEIGLPILTIGILGLVAPKYLIRKR